MPNNKNGATSGLLVFIGAAVSIAGIVLLARKRSAPATTPPAGGRSHAGEGAGKGGSSLASIASDAYTPYAAGGNDFVTPSPLLNELLASNVRDAVDSYNGAKCTGKPHATQPGYHALGPQVFPDEHILTTQKDPAWGAPRAYGTPACASIFHNVCWDKGKDGGMPYDSHDTTDGIKRFRAAFWLNSYGTGKYLDSYGGGTPPGAHAKDCAYTKDLEGGLWFCRDDYNPGGFIHGKKVTGTYAYYDATDLPTTCASDVAFLAKPPAPAAGTAGCAEEPISAPQDGAVYWTCSDSDASYARRISAEHCFRLNAAHFHSSGLDAHSCGVLCAASTGVLQRQGERLFAVRPVPGGGESGEGVRAGLHRRLHHERRQTAFRQGVSDPQTSPGRVPQHGRRAPDPVHVRAGDGGGNARLLGRLDVGRKGVLDGRVGCRKLRQEGVANLQRQPGRRLLLRHPSLRGRVPRQQRRRQGLQAGLHRRRMLPRPEQGYVGHLASMQRCVQRVRLVL